MPSKRKSARLIRAAAAAAAIACSHPALADATTPPVRTMTLTGEGEVTMAPDLAIVNSGVVSEADTARDALSANNASIAEVLEILRKAGLQPRDLQTSNFSVAPRYTQGPRASDGTQAPPRIAGYTVSNTLTATVRDLTRLGQVLDAMVSSGANQLNGLTFSVADPAPARNDARRLAMADAIAKAKLYADAAGVALGPITAISEEFHQPGPQPLYARRLAMAADSGGQTPVAEGEQSLSVRVNVTWEIR